MTDSNYTHIATVVDRSGSMSGMKNDMIGGLNSYFEEQAKLDGKCLVDYTQFDTEYEVVFTDTPAADAKAVLQPRGGTALLDAIGKTIVTLGEKFDKMDEADKPGNVTIVVVTDGYENSSQDWDADEVKALVEAQTEKYNWQFVFLGANMDAVAVAGNYGFAAGNTITYDKANVGNTYSSLNTHTTVTRSAGAAAAAFTDEDRENAVSKS